MLYCYLRVCFVTFALCEVARVVEQKIPKRVALVIDLWLPAQARRFEKRERLEGLQGRPALDDRDGGTGHCKNQRDILSHMLITPFPTYNGVV